MSMIKNIDNYDLGLYWIVLRFIYIPIYIAGLDYIRTIVWMFSFGILVLMGLKFLQTQTKSIIIFIYLKLTVIPKEKYTGVSNYFCDFHARIILTHIQMNILNDKNYFLQLQKKCKQD